MNNRLFSSLTGAIALTAALAIGVLALCTRCHGQCPGGVCPTYGGGFGGGYAGGFGGGYAPAVYGAPVVYGGGCSGNYAGGWGGYSPGGYAYTPPAYYAQPSYGYGGGYAPAVYGAPATYGVGGYAPAVYGAPSYGGFVEYGALPFGAGVCVGGACGIGHGRTVSRWRY